MDASAERIDDLVLEACERLEPPLREDAAGVLEYLRAELLAMAALTTDAQAVAVACGCIEQIDDALARPSTAAAPPCAA